MTAEIIPKLRDRLKEIFTLNPMLAAFVPMLDAYSNAAIEQQIAQLPKITSLAEAKQLIAQHFNIDALISVDHQAEIYGYFWQVRSAYV